MTTVLGIFSFLKLGIVDVLDIVMVAVIIFLVFRWIRGSSAMNIFIALILFLVIQVVVTALGMKMMSAIMNTLLDVGVLALLIIFQPEIRHGLNRIGSNSAIYRKGANFISRVLGVKAAKMDTSAVNEITEACRMMSRDMTGALIVIPRSNSLEYIVETGDKIDAAVSRRLIRNLFFKNSPLHDGAMIISGNRIVAARCTLPITQRTDIPANFGMRHKAAIGITEETDADVIVVSEETGKISFVRSGVLTPVGNLNELKLMLGASDTEKDNGGAA